MFKGRPRVELMQAALIPERASASGGTVETNVP